MSRVFISYKRVDKDKVFRLKEIIEEEIQEKCWVDLDGIESDAQFAEVIIHAIDDCEIFLFMYSAAHLQITDLEQDWTVKELQYAGLEKKRIVFVNIDGSPLGKWFKFMFGQKQQVDATSDSALRKLCLEINKWLGNNHASSHTKKDNKEENVWSESHYHEKIVRRVQCPQCSSRLVVKYTPKKGMDNLATCPKCSHKVPVKKIEGPYLPEGYLLHNRYYVVRTLAAGGFGVVYECFDTTQNKTVAVKEFFIQQFQHREMLQLELNQKSDSFRPDPNVTQSPFHTAPAPGTTIIGPQPFSSQMDILCNYQSRFTMEAQLIRRLNHPSIVKIFDVFDANGTTYYAMEYINGKNLFDQLVKNNYTLKQKILILSSLAETVAYLHANNVVHGDIAPQNVMLQPDGSLKLIDFGLAYVNSSATTSIMSFGQREGYTALECYASGAPLTEQSDVYAFGALMSFVFTGFNPPHPVNLMNKELDNFTNDLPVPGPLKNLVKKCLQLEPHNRPRIQEVASTLEKIRARIETLY